MTNTTTTAKTGDNVSVHYRGTLVEDGTEFDNSYERDPITFTVGEGALLEGFETAITGMNAGDTKTITLEEDHAYGPRDPQRTTSISRDVFPEDLSLDDGATIPLMAPNGQPVMAVVMSKTEEEVTFDVNHPLAGKTIQFDLELVTINPPDTTTLLADTVADTATGTETE